MAPVSATREWDGGGLQTQQVVWASLAPSKSPPVPNFSAELTQPLKELWPAVNRKLAGHFQYYGVSDNWPRLVAFRTAALRLLYKWLNRRSQRRSFTWPRFYAYVDRFGLAGPKRLINPNSAFV